MKKCYKCEVELNEDNWLPYYRGKTNICTPCERIRSRERRNKFSKENVLWQKNNPERTMLIAARSRAKKKGIPFDIEISDIVIPTVCPVLGIPLFRGSKTTCDNSPQLDRLKPERGYTKGNVMVISARANRIKNNATVEELQAVLDWLKIKSQ